MISSLSAPLQSRPLQHNRQSGSLQATEANKPSAPELNRVALNFGHTQAMAAAQQIRFAGAEPLSPEMEECLANLDKITNCGLVYRYAERPDDASMTVPNSFELNNKGYTLYQTKRGPKDNLEFPNFLAIRSEGGETQTIPLSKAYDYVKLKPLYDATRAGAGKRLAETVLQNIDSTTQWKADFHDERSDFHDVYRFELNGSPYYLGYSKTKDNWEPSDHLPHCYISNDETHVSFELKPEQYTELLAKCKAKATASISQEFGLPENLDTFKLLTDLTQQVLENFEVLSDFRDTCTDQYASLILPPGLGSPALEGKRLYLRKHSDYKGENEYFALTLLNDERDVLLSLKLPMDKQHSAASLLLESAKWVDTNKAFDKMGMKDLISKHFPDYKTLKGKLLNQLGELKGQVG